MESSVASPSCGIGSPPSRKRFAKCSGGGRKPNGGPARRRENTSAGVPSMRSFPSLMTATRSQRFARSSILWDTITTVSPPPAGWETMSKGFPRFRVEACCGLVEHEHLRLHGEHARKRHVALLAARELEGAARAISSGLSPTVRRDRSTRLETSSSESPRLRGPKATSSATVAAKSWFSGYWNTTPMRPRTSLAAPFSAMSLPKATTRPLVGCRMPFMCWMRVDLPDPVCPAMPKNSPLRTLRETLSSAQSASGEFPHFACLGAGFLPALRCRRASAAS